MSNGDNTYIGLIVFTKDNRNRLVETFTHVDEQLLLFKSVIVPEYYNNNNSNYETWGNKRLLDEQNMSQSCLVVENKKIAPTDETFSYCSFSSLSVQQVQIHHTGV